MTGIPCWLCTRDLRGKAAHVARAYECDTLYRDVKICSSCHALLLVNQPIEVQRNDTLYYLRPCPHQSRRQALPVPAKRAPPSAR
jgi:hypothetical protein